MCGIAGWVDHGPEGGVDPIDRQLRALDHRGPDSWGVHRGRGAAIGQTRLAIIDLVTGDPPVSDEDGTIGAVLNGEIYNYQALREELRRDGHTLATEGDTEAIAHLAEGLDPVRLATRLHGMFAFAVWDDRSQRLIIGRDRLGKKPLYYWHGGSRLVFGSEIKAVLADPRVPRALDDSAIPAYLTFGYVPTPRTFFDGVRSLPPGHVLVFERGGDLRIERYWRPEIPRPGGPAVLDLTLEEAAIEVRSRMRAAVERRMVADVPVGAFLSGGVDSSTIVALMSESSPKAVRTFTIGFVERLVWHHDQPFGDSSAIPTFLLSELTRKHVTVALCGDGGDEVFGGYERFTAAMMLSRHRRLLALAGPPLTRTLSLLPGAASRGRVASARRFLDRTAMGLPDAFMTWVGVVSPEWREALLGRADNWGTEDYRRIWAGSAGAPVLDRLQDLTLRTYLLDDLLPKVDRMAMAHALEVRSPFLDHEVVELALRLPVGTRARGFSRKRVLKAAAAELLPAEILNRRKRGFGVPLDRWFRSELGEYLEGSLGGPGSRVRRHLATGPLDAMLQEHREGVRNHGHALWALLTLEVFLRREGW